VTAVSSKGSSNYTPRIVAPAGVSVSVSPTVLKVKPGRTATYRVTFTRTTASFDQYAFGSLTWSNGKFSVRSQLAVEPVAAAAPEQVTGTGTSGSTAISVTPGFTGTLTTAVDGLVAADAHRPSLQATGPGFDPDDPATNARTSKETFTVPAGTTLAQFSTFAADFAAGTDVDLFLYQAGTSDLVDQSAGGSAEEDDPPHRSRRRFVRPVRGAVRGGCGTAEHADRADLRLGTGRRRQGQPHRDAGQPVGDRGHGGLGHGGVERADRRLPLPRPDRVRRRHEHRGRHARPRRRLAITTVIT
jgi:hypothetical protein